MSSAVRFSEIRQASPDMRKVALAGIIAEARMPANGSVKALDAQIAEYERKYGLSSDLLLKELSNNQRQETEEILSWLMLIRLRERIGSARST